MELDCNHGDQYERNACNIPILSMYSTLCAVDVFVICHLLIILPFFFVSQTHMQCPIADMNNVLALPLCFSRFFTLHFPIPFKHDNKLLMIMAMI